MTQPKVRFRHDGGMEFPDWSKDKWLNLGQFVSSGTLSKADLSEEGTPCILYGELYTKYGEIAHTIYSKTNSNSHIFSKKDDVILPKSGETPEDISTATCIPYDDVSLGGDLIVFRHNEKVIGTFLSYLISNRAKNAIASIAQGKSVVHISEKGLANIELSFPCIEEQKKIADFLSTVDEVIVQSEVEVQNLEQQKKAAMQKIFSQEVRFRREDGTEFPEWKNDVIENIFEKITDYVAAGSFAELAKKVVYHSEPDYAQLIRTIDVKNSFRNKDFVYVSKEAYEYLWRVNLDNGTYVILPNIGANIGEAYLLEPSILPYHRNALAPNAILLGTSKSIEFYFQYFMTQEFQNKLSLIVGASGQPKFNKTDLKKIEVISPCLEEQQKIAEFFSAYDEAISYTKQELDKWKELKKGLLQQMFV